MTVPHAREVKAAARAGRYSEALQLATVVLREADDDVERESVVRYVRGVGNQEAAAWLAERLADDMAGVVALAAQSVGALDYRPAIPRLQELLSADDRLVRLNAAFALRLLPHRTSVEPLANALGDSSLRVRRYAIEALETIGSYEAVDALERAECRDWLTRRVAKSAGRRIRRRRKAELGP